MMKPHMNTVVNQWRVDSSNPHLRFGQWFMNTYFPSMSMPTIYYCNDANEAWCMILNEDMIEV